MARETHRKTITLDPTVDIAGAYASGDLVCEKLTLTNAVLREGGACAVEKVVVVDQAAQNAPIDLVFFDSDPTGTTFTENAALDVADADADRITGVVSVTAAMYAAFADNSAACWASTPVLLQAAAGSRDLYLAVVSRGTPTYVAAGDLRIRITLKQTYF